jgi:hypothetical protein
MKSQRCVVTLTRSSFVLTLSRQGNSRGPAARVASDLLQHSSEKQKNDKLLLGDQRLYTALNAMLTGDVTQLGPFGGRIVGWEAVHKERKHEASLKLGCTVTNDGKPVEVTDAATGLRCLLAAKSARVHAALTLAKGFSLCLITGENASFALKEWLVVPQALTCNQLFRETEAISRGARAG